MCSQIVKGSEPCKRKFWASASRLAIGLTNKREPGAAPGGGGGLGEGVGTIGAGADGGGAAAEGAASAGFEAGAAAPNFENVALF